MRAAVIVDLADRAATTEAGYAFVKIVVGLVVRAAVRNADLLRVD